MQILRLTSLAAGLALGFSFVASPAVAASDSLDWRNNRVLPLKKITVGPSDNYQGSINKDSSQLYYTQHLSLISSLVEQNLTTGQTRLLLPSDYDAKEPALSPTDDLLAFTLYRFNALGEICLLDPTTQQEGKKPDLSCLGKKNSRQWQAFWVGDKQLGYLEQRAGSNSNQLVIHSLADNSQQVITSGQISTPSASPTGRLLVYSRSFAQQPERNGLYFYNLVTQEETGPLKLDLPGLTSFAKIDAQEQWLYFSQYLNDTNNDQQIDAKDHSVVFRLPMKKVLEANEETHLPQQLTSVGQNCTFPLLSSDAMYLTCDFEGSLDNYRLPLTGQLPASWRLDEMRAAHQQAQSYEERLLLINNQRYLSQNTTSQHLEALLSNHLELNELTAAQHYIKQLIELNPQPAVVEFYQQLNQLLNSYQQYLRLPQGVITAQFKRQITQNLQQLERQAKHQENRHLFSAWLNYFAKEEAASKRELQKITSTSLHPLQNYLRLKLAEALFIDQPEQLAKIYHLAMLSKHLPSNAKLYYAFQWLRILDEVGNTNNAQKQVAAALQQAEDKRLQALLANELSLYQLNSATDEVAERESYQKLSRHLQGLTADIQLKRLAHLRGIQLTGAAEKYNYMELISRHWLTTTPLQDPGFAQTAEYYGSINLSRAYGSLAQGQARTALNSFYALVRQTSSPEGLYQLVYLGDKLDPSLKDRKDRLVGQLQDEELIANPDPFAQAVNQLSTQDLTAAQLTKLAKELQAYQPQGLNQGTADLVTASVFHRLLLLSQKGYSYDKDYYQQAHYHYMLALDLAYNNPRIAAATLHNLGLLHSSVRNYGLASQFFGKRLELPFIQPEEELTTHLLLARSYYSSNRFNAAATASQTALVLSNNLADSPALAALKPLILEKAAFYTTQAGDWNTASNYYQQLVEGHQLTLANSTKVKFSQAYLDYKLGKTAEAKDSFEQVLMQLPQLEADKYSQGDIPGFSPLRLELQSYGFLAQLAEDSEEELAWLNKRIKLLEGLKIKDLRLGFDNERRLNLLILAQLQAAQAKDKQLQQREAQATPAQLGEQLAKLFTNLENWQQQGYSLLDQPLQQGLYNLMSLVVLYPEAKLSLEGINEPLAQLLAKVYKELDVGDETPAFNLAQQLKLKLLHTAYQATANPAEAAKLKVDLQELINSDEAEQIKAQRLELWQELSLLQQGLMQMR